MKYKDCFSNEGIQRVCNFFIERYFAKTLTSADNSLVTAYMYRLYMKYYIPEILDTV